MPEVEFITLSLGYHAVSSCTMLQGTSTSTSESVDIRLSIYRQDMQTHTHTHICRVVSPVQDIDLCYIQAKVPKKTRAPGPEFSSHAAST